MKDERWRSQPSTQPTVKNLFTTVWNLRREGNDERVVSGLIPLNPSRSKKIKEEKALEEQPFAATFLSSHPQTSSAAFHLLHIILPLLGFVVAYGKIDMTISINYSKTNGFGWKWTTWIKKGRLGFESKKTSQTILRTPFWLPCQPYGHVCLRALWLGGRSGSLISCQNCWEVMRLRMTDNQKVIMMKSMRITMAIGTRATLCFRLPPFQRICSKMQQTSCCTFLPLVLFYIVWFSVAKVHRLDSYCRFVDPRWKYLVTQDVHWKLCWMHGGRGGHLWLILYVGLVLIDFCWNQRDYFVICLISRLATCCNIMQCSVMCMKWDGMSILSIQNISNYLCTFAYTYTHAHCFSADKIVRLSLSLSLSLFSYRSSPFKVGCPLKECLLDYCSPCFWNIS